MMHRAWQREERVTLEMDGQEVSRIARMFHWEMGHRLPFHTAGCANVHGHSYRLWVEVEGTVDDNGMLIDFGDLKRLVQPVINSLDHAFLCDELDAVMRPFLEENGFKTVLVPYTTTAENISLFLLQRIWEVLSENPRIHALKIRLSETDNSSAEREIRRKN